MEFGSVVENGNEKWARPVVVVNPKTLRDYPVVLSDVVLQHQFSESLGSNLSGSSDHQHYV